MKRLELHKNLTFNISFAVFDELIANKSGPATQTYAFKCKPFLILIDETGISGNAFASAFAPKIFVRFDKPTKNSLPVNKTSDASIVATGSVISIILRPSLRKKHFINSV